MLHHLPEIIFLLFISSTLTDEKPVDKSKGEVEKKYADLQQRQDKKIEEFLGKSLLFYVLEMDKLAEEIGNEKNSTAKEFVQKLIDKVRSVYADLMCDHQLIATKVRVTMRKESIRSDVIQIDELQAIEKEAKILYKCLNDMFEVTNNYYRDRTKMERKLKRDNGPSAVGDGLTEFVVADGQRALDEFDRRFVDSLRVKLMLGRTYGFGLLTLAQRQLKNLAPGLAVEEAKSRGFTYFS